MSLPADVNTEEILPRYVALKSGLRLHLVDYIDPDTERKFLRISETDLANEAFDPLMKYITDYLNSARRRVLLVNETRMNPRYSPSDVRKHLVVLVSDAANARAALKPGLQVLLCCQVASKDGLVEIQGAWKHSQALGMITYCISASRPSLPRAI